MDQVLVDESSIKVLVVSAVPDFEWLIGEIESEDGWIRFPPFLTNAISNLKIENYPLLYDSESALALTFLRSFLTPEEIKEFGIEFMDRGYIDFERLHRLHEAGSFFVTRAKSNLKAVRPYSHPVDRSTGLICDQTIVLTGFYSRQDFDTPLRRIKFIGPETGKRLVF